LLDFVFCALSGLGDCRDGDDEIFADVCLVAPGVGGDKGILFRGHDVPGVAMGRMIGVFELLCTCDELLFESPEVAEVWVALDLFDRADDLSCGIDGVHNVTGGGRNSLVASECGCASRTLVFG
jgi:hypothetical protein